MRRAGWAAVGVLLVTTVPGLAWAEGPVVEGAESSIEIGYRMLAVDDFRAASPPHELRDEGVHLQAASCIRVAWPEGMTVSFLDLPGGEVSAYVESPVFVAVFDPACSWIAPGIEDAASVVRHEQVHFAITERVARDLTDELSGHRVRGRAQDRASAIARLRGAMRHQAERAMVRAGREHGRFDAAASVDEGQAARDWSRRLAGLLTTAGDARPPR